MFKLIYVDNRGRVIVEYGFYKYLHKRAIEVKVQGCYLHCFRRIRRSWAAFKLCLRKHTTIVPFQ